MVPSAEDASDTNKGIASFSDATSANKGVASNSQPIISLFHLEAQMRRQHLKTGGVSNDELSGFYRKCKTFKFKNSCYRWKHAFEILILARPLLSRRMKALTLHKIVEQLQ